MIPWIKSLLTDRQAFFGCLRGACFGLAGMDLTKMADLPDWLTLGSLFAGGFLRSTGHAKAKGENTDAL